MNVIHILKDGSKLTDITGHVVRKADAESVYHLLHKINEKLVTDKKRGTRYA